MESSRVINSLLFILIGGYLFSFVRNKVAGIKKKRFACAIAGMVAAVLSLRCFGKWNGIWYGVNFQATIILIFLAALFAIAQIDGQTMKIPNRLVFFCMILALASAFLFPKITLVSRVIGMFSISIPLLVIMIVIPESFGGGDSKLMAAIGFFLGWKKCLVAFVFAVFVGGIYSLFLLGANRKKGKQQFAFGPFLCVGTVVAIFAGEQIISWYLSSSI